MTKDHLDLKGFLILLCLTMLWGVNYTAVKIANVGFAPIFNSFLRSSIASACGIVYCLSIKEPLFHRDVRLFHGFIVGLFFGLEFVCIYLGILYTDAARAGILINCSPFAVVVGAYLFLKERLNITKIAGLVLAFVGLYSCPDDRLFLPFLQARALRRGSALRRFRLRSTVMAVRDLSMFC